MNILKLSNGKLELRNEYDSLIRTIVSSGIIDANLNNDASLVIITTDKGKVELMNDNGSLIRTIVSSGAKGGKFSGENIVISLTNGKTEILNINGSLIRTL